MSLVGCPEVELLDEPTTGVDPISSRSLIALLMALKDTAKTAMLMTTHRMDEAEALCDNIAVQVNGRFACYGPPRQLQKACGHEYTVVLEHASSKQEEFNRHLESELPFLAAVVEELQGEVTKAKFEVQESVKLSILLTKLKEMEELGLVTQFGINRANLE